MKKCQAGITVFLSMILIIVLSVVFIFLEYARVMGLAACTEMDAAQTCSSLMAEYSRPLREKYGILCLDGSYDTGSFSLSLAENRAADLSDESLDDRNSSGGTLWNLYLMKMNYMNIAKFELASDHNGDSFIRQAAHNIIPKAGSDALQKLYSLVSGRTEEIQKEREKELPDKKEEPQTPVPEENPVDTVNTMRAAGILSLVLPGGRVSASKADLSDVLSFRTPIRGNWEPDTSVQPGRKLLFQLYLKKYFANIRNPMEGRALEYELEYIIGGKDSDSENLKAVVRQILLIREAFNLAYLETDKEKSRIIQTVSVILTTAAGQPELAPALKHSICAAWAYAESVSDVRLLLEGQCVALVKTDEQWHTDLQNLVSGGDSAEQEEGQDYMDYLNLLLWKIPEKTLVYRCMDLIELNENVRMDHMLMQMECSFSYEADPLFLSFVTIGNIHSDRYSFTEHRILSYKKFHKT